MEFDPEAKYAQLGERVDNQGRRINDLESKMDRGFTLIGSQITSLADDMRKSGRTEWPVITGFAAVTITILGGLGFLALQPIKDNLAEFKMTYAQNRDRGWQDQNVRFGKLENEIGAMVPRAEHETHWDSENQRFNDQQRQIDEIKSSQANTYSARDIILDLKENQQRLEREISDMKTNRGG
jgi:hypothetical protein